MENESARQKIDEALAEIKKQSPNKSDGGWLEELSAKCAPLISDWQVQKSYCWDEWPDEERPESLRRIRDIGIDVVGVRSDGHLIAMQCKSRQLDRDGRGANINKNDVNKFLGAARDEVWKELFLITNGDVKMVSTAEAVAGGSRPVKLINLEVDLIRQKEMLVSQQYEPEPSPNADLPHSFQSRNDMQKEAIEKSLAALKAQVDANGTARGRIILPCGSGKTRIALQLIEKLTPKGEVSVVLCPSIALVAQIRREFIHHAKEKMDVLAVCSDKDAGREEGKYDPTADVGFVKVSQVKGNVTTNSEEIAKWIDNVSQDQIGVIFGTYQSAYRISEALVGEYLANGAISQIGGKNRKIFCLIADEAHRTAGIKKIAHKEEKLRNFTICHNQEKFPATYRIYQTATPKVFNVTENAKKIDESKLMIRSMDDPNTFGVELYRRSYKDAVKNGWLSDYRIIALGINDEESFNVAQQIAEDDKNTKLTTGSLLKGLPLALVMGGATIDKTGSIRSSISFMNTIAKSKQMTEVLNSKRVHDWVAKRLKTDYDQKSAIYKLEHLDASDRVSKREKAKGKLGSANNESPYGICNVGIFGEGTDAPSLSAVAFLEPRRSPADVIQAVGRVMRRSPGKEFGYIICPVVIPRSVNAENWLRANGPENGWRELAEILQALRAHDKRIEENLADLMEFYLPADPDTDSQEKRSVTTFVTIGSDEKRKVRHFVHKGPSGAVIDAAHKVVQNDARPSDFGFYSVTEWQKSQPDTSIENSVKSSKPHTEFERIITVRVNSDESTETREDGVIREATTKGDQSNGETKPIDIKKTKKHGVDMINRKKGRKVNVTKRKTAEQKLNEQLDFQFGEEQLGKYGITVNLLERSGLTGDRVKRDVNILQNSIAEACRALREDDLEPILSKHFGLDKQKKKSDTADGCTIAALLLMNAAMLHQLIATGGWLDGVSDLDEIKVAVNASKLLSRQWNEITRWDFVPIFEPAIGIIDAITDERPSSGLNAALCHIAKDAAEIAETYADLGADHAGPLFNKVMGNQASDGAFFTRPPAASILARLALDAASEGSNSDFSQEETWRAYKSIDLACGSGTLLTSLLTDMKRRARLLGANEDQLAKLQKLAIEELIGGFDMNPVSLQLAASQLITGNKNIKYEKINLYCMPYGATKRNQVAVGSIELLLDEDIVPTQGLNYDYDDPSAQQLSLTNDHTISAVSLPKGAARSAANARIVIMNPPFTNRGKMAEKFDDPIRKSMRSRVDSIERHLLRADSELQGFGSKNSIGPLFEALAEKCLDPENGVLAMIWPTIAVSGPDNAEFRKIFCQRFHIHTLLTCHQPGNVNLSQNTGINESMIIATRLNGTRPATRIINLDRLPINEEEVDDFHTSLLKCNIGMIPNGWGEVSKWSAERVANGDWTGAIWRSTRLAEVASAMIEGGKNLFNSDQDGAMPSAVLQGGAQLRMFKKATPDTPGAFSVFMSKSMSVQRFIRGEPDGHLVSINTEKSDSFFDKHDSSSEKQKPRVLKHAAHLIVTAGQDSASARLTAVACENRYLGSGGWLPVPDFNFKEAKALSVFLNSTAGRLQLMRQAGKNFLFQLLILRPGCLSEVPISKIPLH